MTSRLTRILIQDPDNPDELILDLGDELCQQLGWKLGDKLEWIDNLDGTFTIKKMSKI